jgi:hypothetical protein
MRYWVLTLAVFLLILNACGEKAPSYGVGQELTLKSNFLVGSTPEDAKQILDLSGDDDQSRGARGKMFAEGRARQLWADTQVRVTSIEGGMTEFRILSGDDSGYVAWTRNSLLEAHSK